MDKMIENLWKKHNEPPFLNPEKFGSVQPDKNNVPKLGLDGLTLMKEKPKIIDMKETKGRKREAQKVSGAHDLKLLDRLENAHKFNSPPVELLARNTRIKINDILKSGSMRQNKDPNEKMTNVDYGVNEERQILIPSFGTCGALFSRHFDILRKLKRRIDLLKQAYEAQADDERTWA